MACMYIIFLISAKKNIDCGHSLEPPRGGSNEYPQSMFWAEIWKILRRFIWNFSFFGGKMLTAFFSIFNKKYMDDPIFLHSYGKGSIFLTAWYMHIFFAQRFFEASCSLGIQWTDCDILSNKKQYMGTKIQRTVYE